MRTISSFLLILLFIAGACLAASGEPVQIGESLELHSEVLGEDRRILVSVPDDYALSENRYPVLYLLDGSSHFHHTTGQIALLAEIGHMPEMIVVAITNTDRTRDLTPSSFTPDPEDSENGDGNGENPMPTAGGADTFLDFIEQELFPYVDESYRTAPYRILIGHSFGGLFAVHALITRPDSFDAYVAISPSLWWEEGETVGRAREAFANGKNFGGRTLYMSLADEGGEMLTEYQSFHELLSYRAPEGLVWQAMMMEGDDHGSTPLRSTYHGLKAAYPRWRMPRFLAQDGGLDELREHYAELSRDYDYKIQVPENAINQLGYRLLGQDKTTEAVEVLRHNVESYPASANVHDSLGDALNADGQLAAALKSYERACERGREIDSPNLDVYERNRDEMKAKIEAGES